MVHSIKYNAISKLIRTGRTVFSFSDISLIWSETNPNRTRVRINYYVKKGELLNIRPGLYAIDKDYSRYELAGKILRPSYISLETVLFDSGIIFQKYFSIFLISYLSREIKIDGTTYVFKKIRNEILNNPEGIIFNKISIASKERAFLDTIYLYKDYYFDNLKPLDREKILSLTPLYKKIRLEKEIKKLFKNSDL